MEITVNINAPELSEAINKLAEAIERGGTTTPAPKAKAEPKAATKANTEPKAAPKEEPAPEEPKAKPAQKEEPAPAPKAEAEATFTLIQVREKLAELSRSGKQAQVKALIEEFGASKLSDIKEEDYAALMAEAEEL